MKSYKSYQWGLHNISHTTSACFHSGSVLTITYQYLGNSLLHCFPNEISFSFRKILHIPVTIYFSDAKNFIITHRCSKIFKRYSLLKLKNQLAELSVRILDDMASPCLSIFFHSLSSSTKPNYSLLSVCLVLGLCVVLFVWNASAS